MRVAPILLCLALGSTGCCTLLGGVVGSDVAKHAEVADLAPYVGAKVDLYDAHGEKLASGTLDGFDQGRLHLHDGPKQFDVPFEHVVKAERVAGNYAVLGASIGAVVDVGVLVTVIALVARTSRGPSFCFGC